VPFRSNQNDSEIFESGGYAHCRGLAASPARPCDSTARGITREVHGGISRKKNSSVNATPTNESDLSIGRKFPSNLNVDECIDNFVIVKELCYKTTGSLMEIDWRVPSDIGSFKSSQGDIPTAAPVRAVANALASGGQIYRAIWNGRGFLR
jgi:hypothetical protein